MRASRCGVTGVLEIIAGIRSIQRNRRRGAQCRAWIRQKLAEYWTRITGSDLDRHLELRVEELVVFVLALFVVLRLGHGFLQYILSKVLGGLLTVGCCLDSFSIPKSSFVWKAMLVKSACGFVT